MNWQAIETAPKEEFEYLILGRRGDWVVIGHWFAEEQVWLDAFEGDYISPSHWMPLPEPPQ